MGFYTPEPDPGMRGVIGRAPPAPEILAPGAIGDAAFRQDNTVVNLFHGLTQQRFPIDENHNPLDIIRGTPFEQQYLDRFVGSQSEPETRQIMSKIEGEEKDRQTLEGAGFAGVVAQMIAGTLDPTIALPAGQIVKAGRGGYSLAKSAASIGAAGGLQSLTQEGILQATQESRPLSQSAVAVGSATVLSALLGAGAAKLLTPAERQVLEAGLDRARADMDAHAGNVVPLRPDVTVTEATTRGLSAREGRFVDFEVPGVGKLTTQVEDGGLTVAGGSAFVEPPYRGQGFAVQMYERAIAWAQEQGLTFRSDFTVEPEAVEIYRALQRRGYTVTEQTENRAAPRFEVTGQPAAKPAQNITENITEATLAAAAGAAATDTRRLDLVPTGTKLETLGTDPMTRTFNSESIEGKRAIADLAETPLLMQQNIRGEPTTLNGPPVNRRAILELNQGLIKVGDEIDRLFGQMRGMGDNARFIRPRAWFQDKFGEGGMTLENFKREVSGALMSNDTHAIPEVAEAASFIRNNIFQKWGERAEAAIPEFKMKEFEDGESYFPHVFDKAVIRARRPEFTNVVVSHLEADQRVKAGIKERLTGLNDQLKAAQSAVEKAKTEEAAVAAKLRHDELRAKIEEEIAAWEGKSVTEAKSAIKAREKYAADAARETDAPRLRSADEAIDRAVARIIESDRDLSVDELRGKANEITNHVLGSPDGRLPYDMHTGGPQVGWTPQSGEPPRGALARRDFAIPTTAIRDFLEQDVEHVVQTHLRTVVPDVLLAERFGDTRMTEALRKVEDEYAAKIDAAGPGKEAERLGKQRERVIGDIAAVRDRIRGVYGADIRAAMPMLARAADAAKNFNYVTSMGSATISSLPDMAGTVFRHGLGNVFREAWAPYFQGLTDLASASREQARQLRSMGVMVETDLALRVHELNDITATHKPQSRLERTMQFGADKFGLVNMLAPWTDRMKAFAGGVAMSEILRATEAVAKGTASAKQVRTLGESNIDPHMANRINEAFTAEGAGEIRDGVHLPNVDRWTDKQAREAFEAAVAREADIAVVTPGQEKPRWLSNPVVGILGQFKSFSMAATQRILIANLQRRDAEVLHGLVLSIGLGMLSYKLNGLTGGTKTSDRPQDWFREGISKSGITGWLEEGNALASKATGGKLDAYRVLGSDKPLTRFASRSAMDQVLGPTAGKLENMLKATSAAGRMDWKESDTKAVRRLIAGQNLFQVRRLFDEVERNINDTFGIEMKVKP